MDISLNYMNLKTVTVMAPLPHKGVRVISLKLKKNTISCRSSSTSNPYYETMQDKKKVNFYELLSLGSDKNVDLRDIKKAYRSMALQYHPDVCPDPSATRRFVELQKAYETLSNPVSRRLYDYELSLAHDNLGLGFGVEGMRRSSSSSSSMFIKEVWENQLRGLRRRSEIRMKKRKC
ncbi:chaperone protein dnaJ 20, chloroplastic-like [Humulus lupulus]|uniref:chaperone protein dnaJ 20, chloroplastic-like n=1 Tax=Humulus lupulus TaxID=3486 RepID=UPI002B4088BA|nr:chaperone protein dnaJ 20, chloroplastic-like [Humulus lupulus]